MLCPPMSSSPSPFGRKSSPLNPYASRSSSPPMASASSSSMALNPSSPTQHRTKTRYKRPEQKKYLASAPTELFAENTTPIEGQMWRGQFRRRAEERQRRKNSREAEVDRRRGSTGLEEAEDEAKAREDDEEIFRRLMVHQRKRAQAMFEDETGASDPVSPDFWDESPSIEDQRAAIEQFLEEEERDRRQAENMTTASSIFQTPNRARPNRRRWHTLDPVDERYQEEEEEQWAMEAARAEEAEQAEELQHRRAMEASQRQAQELLDGMEGMDIDMDWDMDSE